ncbi:lasso peptide biosynthesis B2 protein [Methanobacterium alcaliphilum]|uniref:lasso peptide biosynthesis B2 protein n=1 Tax=Methanobacterium alcaliphilum TaxID=392018 RepID=UPI00200A02CE|nr:lasso peptide biosynthesis B2 protein [Methanobacterium alcaliphilum]MCK9150759.1 lasso peptide biosynthesis B2 protein [Methanobacterium alcaliphilum]
MSTIHSFFKLDHTTRLLLIKAVTLQWFVRIMLWILPFTYIQKRIENQNNNSLVDSDIPIKKLIWAVKVTSRYTPRSTCLTRALTGQILLVRYHYSGKIMIGVSKNEGNFEAHAWLVSGEDIVLGESEKEFVPIMDVGKKQ